MSSAFRSLALASIVLTSCSEPADSSATRSADRTVPIGAVTPAAAAIGLGVAPLAVDEHGVPRLVRGNPATPAMPAADASTSARMHIARLAPIWGVREQALPSLVSLGEVALPSGTIVRLRQDIDGLPVDAAAGGELHVMVDRTGALLAASGSVLSRDTPHAATTAFAFDDSRAVALVINDHYQTGFAAARLAATDQLADGARLLAGQDGSINVSRSRARQVWYPRSGALVKAWVVEAYTSTMDSTTGDAFRTVVADDGSVLARADLTADAAYSYRAFGEDTGEHHPFDGPIADSTPNATGVPFTTPYPPYVLPNLLTIDGLNHPAGSDQPDPWLPASSSQTVGNNVDAYTDLNPPDGLTAGDFRATTTAPGAFDRIYDTSAEALASQDQQMAAITSLFYVLNFMHDFWYDGGFTEAAGNGQTNNYGRGGDDHDAMLGEAEDGAESGSRNNANMATPADGLPGRMQVFVWDGKDDRSMAISGRAPTTGGAEFGPKHFDITASVALAIDSTAPVTDACDPLTGNVAGEIVVVDRGGCTFRKKALNVQNAGGAAIIIADNNPANAAPPQMGDDPMVTTPITIGILSVLNSEGVKIKADLVAGPVTATIHRNLGPDLDGSLDASVIGHEFGHFVHHRLSQCNTPICLAMSEGWADFSALLLVSRAGDDFSGAFPLAIYSTLSFQPDPVFYGIRRAPYTTNHAINGLSFRHMAQGEPLPPPPFNAGDPAINNEVHNAGEVWASMLWEGYAALQQQPGAVFDDVRLKMRQYVVAGLLLAPVDATPTESRDALLAAVHIASPVDHDILAAAYARRGFGSCAVSPDRGSNTFTGIVESAEVKGRLAAGTIGLALTTDCDRDGVLDAGEAAHITVPIANAGQVALADVAVTLSSTTPGMHITSPTVTIGALPAYGVINAEFDIRLDGNATTATSGDFTLHMVTSNGCAAAVDAPISIRINTDDAPDSSTTDTFDARSSVWTPTGSDPGLWSRQWATPTDGVWVGADAGQLADASLVSPPLTATGAPLTISFSHRYAFEASGIIAFDGGVIELSTDGQTWQDISTIADPGYNATLTSASDDDAANPLAGRRAFGGTSLGYPATTTAAIDLGTALAGQTFQLRFRIGSDSDAGGPGWQIDNITFTGIVGTPFPARVADAGACNTEPVLPAGCCQVGGSGFSGPGGLALGVLAVLLRRRRR